MKDEPSYPGDPQCPMHSEPDSSAVLEHARPQDSLLLHPGPQLSIRPLARQHQRRQGSGEGRLPTEGVERSVAELEVAVAEGQSQ